MLHHKYITCLLCVLLLAASHTALAQKHRWNSELNSDQQAHLEAILQEAEPKISLLRQELYDKIQELKSFAYTQNQDQQALATLGQELQDKRQALRQALKELDETLIKEVGVSMHGYRGRDCNSLAKDRMEEQDTHQKYSGAPSHHIEQ